MKFHHFNSPETKQLFQYNELAEFEQLWNLECGWFEAPNYRRNGWSGVSQYELTDADNQSVPVFIKRQENHNCKTLLHPLRGVPTFRREFINIRRLEQHKIPTLNELYYGERVINGKMQSILITRSLLGYRNFEDYFQSDPLPSPKLIGRIMQIAGQNTRQLHNAHFRHGSLYPKHYFVKVDNDIIDVRLIDLEKLRWYPLKRFICLDDLSRFMRRKAPLSKEAMGMFLDNYLQYGDDLSHTALAQQLKQLLEDSTRV